MPKTHFKFEVSTIKPTAIIFAQPFLKKTIAKLLRKKGLTLKNSGEADYIIDSLGTQEAVSLAQKQGVKYLRLVIGQEIFSPLEIAFLVNNPKL